MFSTWTHYVLTVVRYERLKMGDDVTAARRRVERSVDDELNSALLVNSKLMKEEHTLVWDKLWYSGFGISNSLAPRAINGDDINMTMYYVMSNAPTPIHELTTKAQHKQELETLLYYPDRCYENHHTV